MIVLHGLWHSEGGLCLWGESAALPPVHGEGTRRRRPLPHPFAMDVEDLEAALSAWGLPESDVRASATPLVLRLPSTAAGPAASPFLVREKAEEDTRQEVPDRFAAWSVPALRFDGWPAAGALIGAWDGSAWSAAAARGLVLADDLRFLAELAKLAMAQVAQGGVLPVLDRVNGGCFARWRVVRTGPAATHLASLRKASPAALRAAEPEYPPAELVDVAFAALIDAMARRALDSWRMDATTAARRSGDRGRSGARPASPAGTRSAAAAWEWYGALASPAGALSADSVPLERLRIALDEWSRPLRDASSQGFRLCLRLRPPESHSGEDARPADAAPRVSSEPAEWRLEFLLQATDDATLLVPAADVWRTRGRVLSAASRRVEDPHERLLEELGRALRLFPPIATALREAAPTDLTLDTAAAHAFLSGAAALEQAGFGVLVPSWWRDGNARLGLQLRARPASSESPESSDGLLGLDAVCAYDWQIALGSESLTEAEFRRLAKSKQPLVRVRGRWVELRQQDIEAALALLGSDENRPFTVRDVLRAGAGDAPSARGLPVVSVVADGWLGELLSSAEGEHARPAQAPASFAGELRPYQERGLGWLLFLDRLGLGACLADDMGLGKTIQLLALLLAEREARLEPSTSRRKRSPRRNCAGPTLLVCPMSVVGNWQREAERFAPSLRVHVHHGGERLGGKEFARVANGADLVLTTYALAARDRDILAGVAWRRIALDEAQNIKNSATRQAQALRSLTASRRVALTGTPVENRLAELWSILDFLNPGLLGSQRSFRERFATPIERYGDDERAAALRRMTAPFILRRVKTDRVISADLPDKVDIKEYCNLTREQASLYQAVVDDMMRRIETSEGMERRGLVLTTMLRLKQVCNHPAHLMADGSLLDGRSGKLERLEEVLEEAVGAGERALVFTQFSQWGLRLRGHLQDRLAREVAFLHGATSKTGRDRIVERFQAGQGAQVLLLSLKAGGTGLNLTAANHVVHFDRWWNPAVEEQASDRAFRIGQTRNVQVRKFICVGTLEERIDEMIERKKALAERIVGSGEAWLTELTTDELRKVVALSADAVAE